MQVSCELSIGNNQDYPNTKILIEGDPFEKSGFIQMRINNTIYELKPHELIAAVERVRCYDV